MVFKDEISLEVAKKDYYTGEYFWTFGIYFYYFPLIAFQRNINDVGDDITMNLQMDGVIA